MIDALTWFATNIVVGFVNLFRALANPSAWLDWSDGVALMRVIYYGGSVEFFFVVFNILLIVTAVGLWRRNVMWAVVRGLEGFANGTGRLFAWVGLLMVLQQVLIVVLQQIFRSSTITIGPFGYTFTRDLSWFSEELKLYNAMIIALCCAYTFVQGGHVRVDLFYAGARYRTKRIIDMFGALFFILPVMVLTWMFGWYFLWRHLVTPKVAASETWAQMERKAAVLRWNVETIGFSPNGFDAYFLFKVLLVAWAGMMFLHGVAVFYRALLEYLEGEASEGRYLDRDTLGDEVAEITAKVH